MQANKSHAPAEAGFSLIELVIAMGVTVLVMGIAATLLGSTVNIRAREDRRSDALADARRSLSAMAREIGNAGYNTGGNGLVAANSGLNSIRVLSDLDRFGGGGSPGATSSPDEDVLYQLVNDAQGQSYITRVDVNSVINRMTVVANRIDALNIRYYDRRVTYTPDPNLNNCDITNVTDAAGTAQAEVTPAQASYVVISLCVQLPAVGSPGSPGHQPASRAQLTSDVQLRNAAPGSY